ncbi:uncharacterized protein B0P05DRAFT_592345 [Gilbertella persicaria]|nr:uncharacterized protein B0P05DRAFT_592345 [Gilbertella persicaria]KAI8048143.1 hypothetical protein B0P05DRAFT_592345 [Gilbertella persicaria]
MYSKQKKQASAELNMDDIDALLNSNLEEGHQDIDMNDPELLKQLQELSSSSVSSKPKQTEKPKQQPKDIYIDLDSYAALAQGDDDIQVELDERDMNDSLLLNELSSLSNNESREQQEAPLEQALELINMGFTQQQAQKALDMFDNNIERAANYLFDSPPEVVEVVTENKRQEDIPEPTDNKRQKILEQDPQYWQKKAQEYQQLALEAKRQGDKKKAVTLLRESKNYSQKYNDLMAEDHVEQSIAPQTPPKERPQTPNPPEPQQISETVVSNTQPAPALSPAQVSQIQELLSKVISLQKQYKEAALHYKKLGNLAAAKQMVRTSKELLHTGIRLKNGEIITAQLPDAPDMTLGDGKIRQIQEFELGTHDTSFEQIEAQLTYEIDVCHNLSIHTRTSKNTKKSNALADSQHVNIYSRLEKAFSADLMVLRANQPNIPSLHFEQVNYIYKNIMDSIPENMMQFKIIRATSLPTLDISTKLDPFVVWDFGGWPPENTAQAAMNKGETPVASGIDPEFDFEMQIPISRTNRLFMRYLQRKKLSIEVLHNKYSYGLFRRPVSLGKITIPMDKLLTKTSISDTFDLLDSSRKKTGGKIEVQINLREPLTGEDIVKRSERWLVLDVPGSNASRLMSEAGLTTGGPYVPSGSGTTQPQVAETSGQNSPVADPKPETPLQQPSDLISETNNQAKPIANDSELEAAEEEFNNVDNIVSNMVLEHELKIVNANLVTKQSAKIKEDLMDRKQALEIKMNMLVIQVQTGILDMDTYLENVQKRMEADRRLALIFKKYNRLDLAKAALARKKIMQDEVEEAKAAMAEQEAEE